MYQTVSNKIFNKTKKIIESKILTNGNAKLYQPAINLIYYKHFT